MCVGHGDEMVDPGFHRVEFIGVQTAAIVGIAPFAFLLADEIGGRGEAGAPILCHRAAPDGEAIGIIPRQPGIIERGVGTFLNKLTRLTVWHLFGGHRFCGREGDEAEAFGVGPVGGGPVGAGGGIGGGGGGLAVMGMGTDPAIGAGERADGFEFLRGGGGIGGARNARGEEQPRAGRAAGGTAFLKHIEIMFEILRREGGGVGAGGGLCRVAGAIEAGEQVPGEAIVVAFAGGDAAVIGDDLFAHAVQRAVHQFVGEYVARADLGSFPSQCEGRAACRGAEGVGGGARHFDNGAGAIDGEAARKGDEEAALAIGGPAIAARAFAGGEAVTFGDVEQAAIGERHVARVQGLPVGVAFDFGAVGCGPGGGRVIGHARRSAARAANRASVRERLARIAGGMGGRLPIRPASTCACHSSAMVGAGWVAA